MRAKICAPFVVLKVPGIFLLHFGHAQVAFGLIVCKGYGLVFGESENRIAVIFEAFNQVVDGRLCESASLALLTYGCGVEVLFVCFGEDVCIALLPAARAGHLRLPERLT